MDSELANLIVAGTAAFIGCGALWVAYKQGKLAVEQGELAKQQGKLAETVAYRSVRPFLSTAIGAPLNQPGVRIEVRNSGLGPAIITACSYVIDGEPVASQDELLQEWERLLTREGIAFENPGTLYLNPGGSFSPGEKKLIFHTNADGPPGKIVKILEKVDFEITFKSLLDEEKTIRLSD